MFKTEIMNKVKSLFPKVEIKSKNDSLFMKILSVILFFNKDFMTQFSTTIGNKIYFPSKSYVSSHPVSSFVILLHELVHIYDYNKYGALLFSLLYFSPQVLALLALPTLFFSWKLALLFLIFLLPIPSFFRMKLEKRAYLLSLYVMKRLNNRNSYNINLNDSKNEILAYFKNHSYYFMWPFSLNKEFNFALLLIESGRRPYEDEIFDILDEIIDAS